MPIIQDSATLNANELTWAKRLYSNLTSISGATITPKNPEDLFTDTSVAYSFTFSYKGIEMIFTRKAVLATKSTGLTISIPNASTTVNSKDLTWNSNTKIYSEIASRKLYFQAVVSDYALVLTLGGSSSTKLCYVFFPFKTEDSYDVLYRNSTTEIAEKNVSTNILKSDIYLLGDEEKYSIKQIFSFKVPGNELKMLDRSFVTNAYSEHMMDLPGVYSCTTVPLNKKINIGNKEYYSLDENIIVEI